jgi:hypothetical protein
MKKILHMLDTTGVKPQFLLEGKKSYTTTLGGVISLLNLIILGLLIYAFGKNFFERTEPSMIQNLIYPERYPNYTLGVDMNFSYAARLEDFDGNVIKNRNLVYIDFIYYHYEIQNGIWVLLNKTLLDYDLCTEKNFEKPDFYNKLSLNTAYCPKLNNLQVGGGWDESYIKYVRMFVRPCYEGKVNNKGEKCGTEAEYKEIFKNRLFFYNYYQEYFVDSDNYEKPMDVVYTNQYFMLDPIIMKKAMFFFRSGTITTDYGWILKDEQSYSKLTYDTLITDSISVSQLPEGQKNIIGEIHLKFSKKQERFTRIYTKIQNLAANVGGIIKVFYSINVVITSFFTIHMMNFNFINFLFSDIQNNNDDKSNLHENFNNSKNLTRTLYLSNTNNFNLTTAKRGDVLKSYYNNKIIPKSPVLNSDNTHNQTFKIKDKEVMDNSQNIPVVDSPVKRQFNHIHFSLKKYLKRHLFCKMTYSKRFSFFEEKLESIMDIKNYLIISYENLMLRNEAVNENSNFNFAINCKPDDENKSIVEDNKNITMKSVKNDNYMQK